MQNVEALYGPYLHDGLLSTEDQADGNMVGTTAMTLALRNYLQIWGWPGVNMITAMEKCQANGKLFTGPDRKTECNIDDYLCRVAQSASFAWTVYRAGPKYFFWRLTGFWPTLLYSIGLRPGLYGRFVFRLSLFICRKSSFKNQDGWLQSAMMILACYGFMNGRGNKDDDSVYASTIAWREFLKAQKMTLQKIFVAYSNKPNHPLAFLFGLLDERWGLT